MRVKTCIAIAAVAMSLGAVAPTGASALSVPLPGPVPPSSCVTWPSQCLIQTRNGGFALSTHMVRAGHTLTGTVSNRCMYQQGTKPCPIFWSYMTDLGKVVHGCSDNDVTCTIKIRKNAPSSAYYVVNVGITSDQGTGYSSDYYAVVGRDQAVISGKVHNKEQQPVANLDVAMFGGGVGNYEAITGPDGSYIADVKRGHYRVLPLGRSLSNHQPPKFEPTHHDVHAHPSRTAHADFKVDIGLVVKLTLSSSSVPADGFGIVQGTIKVTLLGQPQPGVTVALWPKATEPSNLAVTTGARATVCGPNGRIWPGGTLPAPAGDSVNVTTDSNGTYQFTLDVGTVPGPFSVTAWARDSSGNLITHDTADASDEKTGDGHTARQPAAFELRLEREPDREVDQPVRRHQQRPELADYPVRDAEPDTERLQGVRVRARPGQLAGSPDLSGREHADDSAQRRGGRQRKRSRAPAVGVAGHPRRHQHQRPDPGDQPGSAAGAPDLHPVGAGHDRDQLAWERAGDAGPRPGLPVLRLALSELDGRILLLIDTASPWPLCAARVSPPPWSAADPRSQWPAR
ncbi:MAG TPA: hypothetical protein VIX82_15500 [Solirubrobacteraceae bacterium]